MALQIGDLIPNFSLFDQTGEARTNTECKGQSLVLFFYPKDDTPGCTIESKDFSKLNSLISKNNTIVLGISADSFNSHLKFKKKFQTI